MNRCVVKVIAAVLGVGAAAGGCQYTAYVRNSTDRPVHVHMIQRNALNPDWILDSARVDPGANIRLGAKRVSGKIILEAGERTRAIEPALMRLRAGRTSVVVGYQEDGRTLAITRADESDP